MFGYVGSTGWHRRRDLGGHKGNRSEQNFEHLHNLFTEEG